MPSTIKGYAIDYDKNGKIELTALMNKILKKQADNASGITANTAATAKVVASVEKEIQDRVNQGTSINKVISDYKIEVGEKDLTGTTDEPTKPQISKRIGRPVSTRSSKKAALSSDLSNGKSKKSKSVSRKYYIGPPLSGQIGRRAANPNDGVADGTASQGWVRRVRKTPFGSQHWWEVQPK